VQIAADGLRTELDDKYQDAQRIVLVCHSLGGLVARRYLVELYKNRIKPRVTDVLLYGTPNEGAGLAYVARNIYWFNTQLRQLSRNSEFLNDLNRDWKIFSVSKPLRVLSIIGGRDRVVLEDSARWLWGDGNVKVVVDASHRDLVKPIDSNDLRFLILKNVLRTAAPPEGSQANDFAEALPQLVKVLQHSTAAELKGNEDKKSAIQTVWNALEKTRAHLEEIKQGQRRAGERDPELVDLWSDAAFAMSAFDGQLARRLLHKAEYWSDPKHWTDDECNHAGIMMEQIRESIRDLVGSKTAH
jgi:hypothetical protein